MRNLRSRVRDFYPVVSDSHRLNMGDGKKITGMIFSDLGQAASFMTLEWVQRILEEKVGFRPLAGTLNLRLEGREKIACWKDLVRTMKGIDIPPPEPSFCRSRCFPARIEGCPEEAAQGGTQVAVLWPEVKDYPPDKVEVIAPFHVKESMKLRDGDRLTLVFTGD